MAKQRNILFLYLALLILYFSQGILYASGSRLSQISLLLIFIISIIYLLKCFSIQNKGLFYSAWTTLLILNIMGFVFTGILYNPVHFGMLKGILLSSLPFYPIYYYSNKKIIKSKDLIIFFFIMLPVAIMQFYLNQKQILQERLSDNNDVVNNIAYFFVGLLPYIFLIRKNKILSIISFLISLFFIIQGAKRGAVIVAFICTFFFLYYQLRAIEGKKRLWSYITVIAGIVLIIYYAYFFYSSNEYLISRMEFLDYEGGSGRNTIYKNIFNKWYYSDNFINFLFGYGFAGSLKLSGMNLLAHNDWLELVSNFGILGVTLYMLLFYSAINTLVKSKWRTEKKILFCAIITMWFVTSIFSMGYTSTDGYLRAIMLAYLLGNNEKEFI